MRTSCLVVGRIDSIDSYGGYERGDRTAPSLFKMPRKIRISAIIISSLLLRGVNGFCWRLSKQESQPTVFTSNECSNHCEACRICALSVLFVDASVPIWTREWKSGRVENWRRGVWQNRSLGDSEVDEYIGALVDN